MRGTPRDISKGQQGMEQKLTYRSCCPLLIPTLHPYIGETLTGGNRKRKQADTASLLSNPAEKRVAYPSFVTLVRDCL